MENKENDENGRKLTKKRKTKSNMTMKRKRGKQENKEGINGKKY